METRTRRKGSWFFWLLLAGIVSAIIVTVLLAKDRQNLRLLMKRIGHPLVIDQLSIPKPGTRIAPFHPEPIHSEQVMIETRLLAPEVKGFESGLLRTVFKSGPVICETFRHRGIAVTPWRGSLLSPGQMECFAESSVANPEQPDDPSTFFLMIKGAENGTLHSARLKIVTTSIKGREGTVKLAANAADIFGQATGWRELSEARDKILALDPFEITNFGTSIKFSSEFGGPGRFNLILTMIAKTPAEKRTAAYFDRSRFMPLLPDIAAGGDVRHPAAQEPATP